MAIEKRPSSVTIAKSRYHTAYREAAYLCRMVPRRYFSAHRNFWILVGTFRSMGSDWAPDSPYAISKNKRLSGRKKLEGAKMEELRFRAPHRRVGGISPTN